MHAASPGVALSSHTAATPREQDELVRWRRRALAAAGFEDALASRLAARPAVDLHALLQLVDRGCPPHLAARILAPLDSERA